MFPGETPLNTRVIKLLNTASESVQDPRFPRGSPLSIILSLLQLGGDILLAAPCSPPEEFGLLAVLLKPWCPPPSAKTTVGMQWPWGHLVYLSLPFPEHPKGQTRMMFPLPPHIMVAFQGLSKAVWLSQLGCPLLLKMLIAFTRGKHSGLEHPVFHPLLGPVLPNASVPAGAPYNSPEFPTHSTKCFEIPASSLSGPLAQSKRQILILTAICWPGPGCLRDSPWIYLFGFIQKSIKRNTPPRLQAHQP